jgi:hypothetical protein
MAKVAAGLIVQSLPMHTALLYFEVHIVLLMHLIRPNCLSAHSGDQSRSPAGDGVPEDHCTPGMPLLANGSRGVIVKFRETPVSGGITCSRAVQASTLPTGTWQYRLHYSAAKTSEGFPETSFRWLIVQTPHTPQVMAVLELPEHLEPFRFLIQA